ncbi:hypothetical protein [Flavobacterium sp.]|uniref:hypothetical protein n=1 Tax=Flavobacterium sp. TaxID=239 RepID=UPI0039E71AB9
MKMRKILAVIFLLLSFASFAQSDTIAKRKAIKEEKSVSISMIQLIANPEKYDGKRVTISGYIMTEFEGTAIFFSREDYEHGFTKNGIWLNVESDRANIYNKEYGSLSGVFDIKINGHFGAYSGSLKDVHFYFRK